MNFHLAVIKIVKDLAFSLIILFKERGGGGEGEGGGNDALTTCKAISLVSGFLERTGKFFAVNSSASAVLNNGF